MRSNTPRRKEIMRCTTCLLKLHKKCNKELSAFFIYFILFKLTIINQIISYNNQCRAALDIATSLLALLLCVISTYYCCCCLSYHRVRVHPISRLNNFERSIESPQSFFLAKGLALVRVLVSIAFVVGVCTYK